MVGKAGGLLRIAVAVFIAAVIVAGCAGVLAGKSAARANINDYLSKGPNDFYPAGHDLNGSMTKQVIDVLGWNSTRIDGNLGIGNGSVSIFDIASTRDVEYPEKGFMCGDVSSEPWQPGRKNIAENVTNESEGSGGGNVTGNVTDRPGLSILNNTDINRTGNVSRPAANRTNGEENQNATSSGEQASADGENLTYAAYHPVQYLSPIKDILYEHPLATPGTAYCELLGFETPSGAMVNVGMKCTGYGY